MRLAGVTTFTSGHASAIMGQTLDASQAGVGEAPRGSILAGKVISLVDRLRGNPPETEETTEVVDRPDAPLIERFKAGDQAAFGVIYERHYSRVLRVAWRMLGSQALAEDIAQDVFIRAYHALPDFEVRARLSTWLYRVTVNACLDHLKSGRRKYERQPDEGTMNRRASDRLDPDAAFIAEERRALVAEGVSRLPEKYRIVIILRDIEERPYKEIRDILGLPVTTLKMRAIRGRDMLARVIERMVQP